VGAIKAGNGSNCLGERRSLGKRSGAVHRRWPAMQYGPLLNALGGKKRAPT
jgi:hypothetical protein